MEILLPHQEAECENVLGREEYIKKNAHKLH